MDWLAVSLRPKISHSNLVNPLISEYIQVDNLISVVDIEGYHLYNDKIGFDAFFDKNQRRYRTGMIANESQKIDIQTNGNIM